MSTITDLLARSREAIERAVGPICQRLAGEIEQRPGVALGVAFAAGVIAARLIR